VQERKTGRIGYLAGKWPLDAEKPTLIFIHGAGNTGYFWQPQFEALSDRVNTIALDLPGHGRSDGPGKDTIEDYAQAIDRFVDDIAAPRPIPCGLSLGGAIVQQLLLDFPEHYSAGILMGTGVQMKVGPVIFETIAKDYAEFVEMIIKFAVSKKSNLDNLQVFKDELSRCAPEVVSGDFRACDRFDVSDRVSAIKVPVLVITSEDDILAPAEFGDVLEEKIQNARRVHIMDAGHIMSAERPDEVNSAISEFLDKIGSNKA
jgi:pimeloyl-ACP methyl ester carboxylesterase